MNFDRPVKRRGAGALLCVALLLAGCATKPPVAPGETPWTTGRLSVRVAATASQPVQSMTAAFELRGSGESGELRLNSPLGNRVAAARWAPGVAVLASSDGEQRYASLDELSRRALGETMPLAALPDWLAGRPWPGAPHRVHEGGFEQLGWRVQLAQRAEGIVEARRAAPREVVVRVKIEDPS